MTEAERLAATLESDANDHRAIAQSVDGKPEHTTNWQHMLIAEEAAAELRRLDEELTICAQLKRGYRDLYAQAMTECEQLRGINAELLEALQAAVSCGMVPTTTAKEGGASAYSEQVRVADQIRAAIGKAKGETK